MRIKFSTLKIELLEKENKPSFADQPSIFKNEFQVNLHNKLVNQSFDDLGKIVRNEASYKSPGTSDNAMTAG